MTLNKCAPANRRYASPLGAERQFTRAFHAQPRSPAAAAELGRRHRVSGHEWRAHGFAYSGARRLGDTDRSSNERRSTTDYKDDADVL